MSLEGLINVVALVLTAYLLCGGAPLKQPTIPSCWVSPVQLGGWTFAATPARGAQGMSGRPKARRRPCNTSNKHAVKWTLMDNVGEFRWQSSVISVDC